MSRTWRVAIVKDTSKPMLGLHGLHVAFNGLPGVEIVAHVDSNTDDLPRKLAVTGAKRHYASLTEMLDAEAPDIVGLCSRHPADHLAQIEAAAAAGCHVYCEKPLTASLHEADRMVQLTQEKRIRIGVAHLARYALVFRTMKTMVQAGQIGVPTMAAGRGKCDHRGGGEDLIVLGTHILDLQTFLFGAPEYVYADVTVDGRPIARTDRTATVEPIGPAAGDEVFAYFRFPHDVRGTFESKRGLVGETRRVTHLGITIIGTDGALSMRFCDTGTRTLHLCRHPGPPEECTCDEDVSLVEDRDIPGAAPLDYSLCGQPDIPAVHYFLEANRFAAWDLMCAIEEERQPISSVHDARLALEMIYGIYAAHLSGGKIGFPLENRAHPLGD